MATRAIPLLKDDARVGESRLLHATVVIRHGARTPWSNNLQCWGGYHDNPQTSTWDCNLTTYLAPPPPAVVNNLEQGGGEWSSSNEDDNAHGMFLFEKQYTALHEPAANLSNALLGTCELGQLLLQGYEQQITNGHHLRNAYVYDGSVVQSHDERMRLIDISSTASTKSSSPDKLWHESNVYYRSDDDQRTLMSGQVLLRGLFGPEIQKYYQEANQNNKNANNQHRLPFPVIPVHTADRSRDIMDANEGACPRLAEMHERLVRSKDYQSLVHSSEAQTLRRFVNNVLFRGASPPSPTNTPITDGPEPVDAILMLDVMDCLMTTMCTDRPLPAALDDYTGPPTPSSSGGDNNRRWQQRQRRRRQQQDDDDPEFQNMFQRLYDYHVARTALLFRANNAEYAKLAMAPLWVEILPHLLGAMENSPALDSITKTAASSSTTVTPAKLALFSGHDTTLMPLLASLGPDVWDGQWAPYAASLIIEIHAVHIDGRTDKKVYTTDHAFRLLYNGKVITHRVPGCPADENVELCDAVVLLKQIQSSVRVDDQEHEWIYGKQCQRQFPPLVPYTDSLQKAQEILATPGGWIAIVVVMLTSGILGAVSTLILLRTRTGRSIVSHWCSYCCCCFGMDQHYNRSSMTVDGIIHNNGKTGYKDEDSEHEIALTSPRNDEEYSDDPPIGDASDFRENGYDDNGELGIS
jgi:Histidine phosphatase superfamily (branch 2)